MGDHVREVRRGIDHLRTKHRGPRGADAVRRGEGGQAMTELALLVPLLLVLVFGVIELANAINEAMTIAAATREGARVAGALVNGGGGAGAASRDPPQPPPVHPRAGARNRRRLP